MLLFGVCLILYFDVSLPEKKLTNVFVEFHHFTEAATESPLQKRCS